MHLLFQHGTITFTWVANGVSYQCIPDIRVLNWRMAIICVRSSGGRRRTPLLRSARNLERSAYGMSVPRAFSDDAKVRRAGLEAFSADVKALECTMTNNFQELTWAGSHIGAVAKMVSTVCGCFL
jgi:hypothetical protein